MQQPIHIGLRVSRRRSSAVRSGLGRLAAAFLLMSWTTAALAQNLPKSIKIIVPFPAGGSVDILARHIAHSLETKHSISVIVETRAGGASLIGTDFVAKSANDGSVLLLAATSHSINPSLYKKLPYANADFSPIALVAVAPNALVVSNYFEARSVSELIANAKANPGKLSFASAGTGGANHLAGELFKQMAGVDLVHIPYKGAAPAMNDLIGGHIPLLFNTLATVIPVANSGSVRILAVTSLRRAPTMPDIPTLDELGLKGFEALAWFGLFMPQANNSPVCKQLITLMTAVLSDASLKEKFAAQGMDAGTLVGDDFARFVKAETEKWGRVVKAANIPQE